MDNKFILILSYDIPSYSTNNTCEGFLMFQYFSSYELFLKIAFLSIQGHFAFIRVKIQSSLPLC